MGTELREDITGLHHRLDGLRDEVAQVLIAFKQIKRRHRGKLRAERERLHNLEIRALNIRDMLDADKRHADARIDLEKS